MHNEPADGASASQETGGPDAPKPEAVAEQAPSESAGQAAADPAPARRSRLPRRGTVIGVLSALVLVAAGGGLLSAASLSPQGPGSSRALEAPLAAVPAGSSVGLCPGPARLLEGTPVGTDPQFSPESATANSVVNAIVLGTPAGTVPGSRLSSLKGKTVVEIAKAAGPSAAVTPAARPVAGSTVPLAGVVPQRAVDAVTVLSADAQANRQASAGAIMSYTAGDGDLRGAAAAACQQPANDLWLVGANTALGRTAVLNLSNASGTPATVSLDLYGAEGLIQAPGSRGLLVAPGSTRSVNLAGLAPGQERLGLRVRSAGGPVAAQIQQSVLRGLIPGGVDFIVPGTAPAVRQVISGVDIQDPDALAALIAKPGLADAGPSLQIAVPGSADAVVAVKLYGPDGQKALPGGGVVKASAGAVTEVSLAGVPAGYYTVEASSDVSFTAAARVTKGLASEEASDVAWSPASGRLGSQHVVPVPAAGDRSLVFGAPEGPATVSYTPVTADGKVRTAVAVDVAAGSTAAIKVPAEVEGSPVVGYLLSAAGEAAYGAVLLQQDGTQDIAAVAVAPGAAGQEQVPVTLGY